MIRWLVNKIRQRTSRQQEQSQIAAEEFRRRLLAPDFEVVTQQFNGSVSESIRQLYSEPNELLKECITKQPPTAREDEGMFISWYIPWIDNRLPSNGT